MGEMSCSCCSSSLYMMMNSLELNHKTVPVNELFSPGLLVTFLISVLDGIPNFLLDESTLQLKREIMCHLIALLYPIPPNPIPSQFRFQ
ncbi:hypothetical protein HOLleu_06175 [Holothuria leucospilota]|uniref:Uncharacterized protein n=1 Tax=Holothuria leucospilota TaxID=206669 RepID=A0A9Q1CM53_HOLLE|nr:hypothetical protein HOLleu_06175 [Holothuria leucospilota]